MGCSFNKALGVVAMIHVILGVLSVVFGIVALKVIPLSNGVFGMGIWLGGWMLITGVAGLVSAHNTQNFCKLGGFVGCCLVGMVTMCVCAAILGFGVLKSYIFESTVTREYYKEYDYAKYVHENYYKPQEYFDERNRIGRIGCGVYGSLLAIIVLDVLISFASCYIGRAIINKAHITINTTTATSQRRRVRQRHIPDTFLNRERIIVRNQSPGDVTSLPSQPIVQDGFISTPYYPGPKLPNYLDIYPEGSPTWLSSGLTDTQPETPLGPPPEYTPTDTTNPSHSTNPSDATSPADTTSPADAINPIEPTDPTDPTELTDLIDPTCPTDTTNARDPMDDTASTDNETTNAIGPIDTTVAPETTNAIDPMDTTVATDPTDTIERLM